MIGTINVQDIRSLTDTALDLSEGVTLVLGDNGTGKSTLAAAVEYALLGTCEWTDGRGAGYAALIRHGAKSGKVSLMIGDLAIERTMWVKKSALTVGNDDGDKARGTLAAMLPEPEILRCMLRSGAFIGLPSKEQRDILFSLAGGEMDAAWFKARLSAKEQEALGKALATAVTGPALADALHKTAYEARSEANGVVKQLGAQANAEAPSLPPDAATEEGTLSGAVAKGKQDLAGAQQALGKAQADHEAIAEAKRRAEAARAAYLEAKAALEALGDAPKAPDAKEIEAAEKALAAAERARADIPPKLAAASITEGALKEQYVRVKAFDGTCVLSSPELTVACPMSDTDRDELLKRLDEQCDAAQSKCDALEKALAEATGDEQRAREKADRLAAQARAHDDWEHKRDRAIEARDAAQHRLDAANADAERPFQPLPAAQAAVDAAQAKLDEAEAALVELSRAMDAHAAHKRAKRELADAEARAEMLDALVKRLAEGGPLRTEAASGTVDAVLAEVNAALEQFTDFTLKLDDGDLGVIHGGDRTALHLLSESEKLRVGAAIQVAFAKLTGFGFVIVDAADRLDTYNRGPLLGMLLNSDVKALVTATPLGGTRPQAPGLAVYDLADGRAAQATRAEEVAA